MRISFIQYQYTKTYYNLEDLITQLGGISASISLALGTVAFLFAIKYAALLGGVVHRKYKEMYRVFQIKAMTKLVPSIKEKL